MKNKNISFFSLSISLALLLLAKQCKNNELNLPIKFYSININRKLEEVNCNIKNCASCDEQGNCLKCKENQELVEGRCYSTECKIYGFCKYCDEFDCLKCNDGYQLNYGVCEVRVNDLQRKIFLFVVLPILIIGILTYLYCYCKKRARTNIETGKVLKFKHPKAGNYIIIIPKKKDESLSENSSTSKSLTSTFENNVEKEKMELNVCVVCAKKKIYTFADCGCPLCLEHYKNIKGEKESIICRNHNIQLTKNIIIQLGRKSNIKGNAVEKLGLSLCPVCKINYATQSFNCGCTMKICEKCFNDNVYVFKYNQCPGCGSPYVPKKEKKKDKKNEDSSSTRETKEAVDESITPEENK